MAPTQVQVSNSSGVFPAAVTPGNTIVFTVVEYSAPTVTVTNVQLGTTTVAGTTQLEFPQSAGGTSGDPTGVCIYLLPNVQVSGQTTVNYTCSGSVICAYAEEWSGLGSSPVQDTAGSITATGASASIASGTTGARPRRPS